MILSYRVVFLKFKTYLKRISLLLLIILLIYVLKVIFSSHTSNFNLTAKTEIIEFKTLDQISFKLLDVEATIFDNILDSVGKTFSGTIKLNPKSRLKFERLSKRALYISVEHDSLFNLGSIYDLNGNKDRDLGDFFELRIDSIGFSSNDRESLLFPINGKIKVGQLLTKDSPTSLSLLEEGQIKIINLSASSLFSIRNTYVEDTFDLNLGDTYQMYGSDVLGFGLLRIDHNPGISVSYNASAKEGVIYKAGSPGEGIPVKGSLVKKLFRDSFFQGASSLLGTLGILLGVISFFFKDKESNP